MNECELPRKLGMPTDMTADIFLQTFDYDGNGYLTPEEFQRGYFVYLTHVEE